MENSDGGAEGGRAGMAVSHSRAELSSASDKNQRRSVLSARDRDSVSIFIAISAWLLFLCGAAIKNPVNNLDEVARNLSEHGCHAIFYIHFSNLRLLAVIPAPSPAPILRCNKIGALRAEASLSGGSR
jgi:hypothetical protein